jgi:tetratricopeptide (TPR) repeat protein
MISLPLKIRRQSQPVREPVAWLLPSGDPAAWLEELVAWGVPLQQLTLYPLATREEQGTSGVLVLPRSGLKPATSYRAVPYGVVGGRIYLPVDAALEPETAGHELEQLFATDIVAYVFHPTWGLTALGRDQELAVSDLVQMPPRQRTDWDRAQPGIGFHQQLYSIVLADPPAFQEVLNATRDDISSQSSSISELPPSPSEPSKNPIGQAGRAVSAGIAKAVLWMTNLAPSTATKPTWINSVQDWAASKLAAVSEAVDAIRNREIHRLLDLLENNPDEGLRYAMPVEGSAHRGIAPPANHLARHDVDFSLSALGGRGPVDYWAIDWQHRQRLIERYRELVNREIRLGRHRRAAYIFAELLHDMNAAARTLMDGGHYREAAVLYRERLGRPREAAECLQKGGLLGEAIKLFRELGDLERVGDLYARLDQHDESHQAYRVAADAYAAGGDLLGAARILENKMQLPDEAIAALEAAWPNSPQARNCLEELFDLFGRSGRHEAAVSRVIAFRDASACSPQTPILAATLSRAANSYPDDALRELAADSCRVVAGRRIRQASQQERRELLNAVEQLAREDRLLRRDCGRFRRERVKNAAPQVLARIKTREPQLINSFALPEGVVWKTIAAANTMFYVAGYRDDELVLIRGNWDGDIQQPRGTPWRVPMHEADERVRIAVAPRIDGAGDVLIGGPQVVGSPPRAFSPTDRFIYSAKAVAAPADQLLADLVRNPSGVSYLAAHQPDGGLVVHTYSDAGALLATQDLQPDDAWKLTPSSVFLHARSDSVYLATGSVLLRLDARTAWDLPSPITSLIGTAAHTRVRLAITCGEGGLVVWPEGYELDIQRPFGKDLFDPVACFTKNGALVAVSKSACEVYDTNDEQVSVISSMDGPFATPVAVTPAGRPDEFAILTTGGTVRVYRIRDR